MADDIAIRVEHVSKDFVLPHEKNNTIKSVFTSLPNRKKGGKEVQHALKGINFDVKQGEFFGIVGRNGSGKSTLLKILAGIYQPTTGTVHTRGKLVPFIELGVGFNPELTGRDNVYLNGAMLGFSRKEVDVMYDDIVSFAELGRFMDQKLKNYSSGMQVRLAFSMATRAEADILLVDEVLAVGDADFQRKCFNHFRKLKKQKKTVIFVSHDMGAVREYCDRVIMIEKSEIVKRGTANEVAVEYIKLFNNQEGSEKSKRGKTRWGDQKVVLDEVDTQVTEDFVNITAKFTAKDDSEDPVLGYLIKDASGGELMGSNTKIRNVHVGSLKKGDKRKLTWKIPNVFNDGVFLATVAISHRDAITQHDWWENAGSFTIFREDKTSYAINPNVEVIIK